MALLTYRNIGITGIAAAVPENKIINAEFTEFFTPKEVKSVSRMTGIKERRVASDDMCASDLCYAAAEKLFTEMNINREEIDILIFISQTPDYRMPATGIILQSRLGLPKTTGAFDINLGCSGYSYGLALAYGYAAQENIRKVLLLNGETRTKVYSFKDKSTGLLFGDGGCASIIEKISDENPSFFSLNSDGARSDLIKIKAGGYRYPSSLESLEKKTYEDSSIRNDEQGVMDGAGIFDFTIQEIPEDIKRIFEFSGESQDNIDFYLMHQANKFITDHIAKKMKIPKDRVPYSIQKFGNTSSVSIPLTIVSELRNELSSTTKRVFMTGFGVGLSWACAITSISNCVIPELVEI
ncbi:MAG: ketoacyl-ACP synthase III [Candidatus Cloacimonetes bacterium]|nr:ketoacyl-ACP synthase III [Candidatus Cloacimonadota bacterium]